MRATSLIVAGTPFSGAVLLGRAPSAHPQAFFAGESWRCWADEAAPGARECRTWGSGRATWNDPAVASARADSRIQCRSTGPGAAHEPAGAAPGLAPDDAPCWLDPAQPFAADELEQRLRARERVGSA